MHNQTGFDPNSGDFYKLTVISIPCFVSKAANVKVVSRKISNISAIGSGFSTLKVFTMSGRYAAAGILTGFFSIVSSNYFLYYIHLRFLILYGNIINMAVMLSQPKPVGLSANWLCRISFTIPLTSMFSMTKTSSLPSSFSDSSSIPSCRLISW